MQGEWGISLDALLLDPAAVSKVSLEQATALLGRLSSVQALLVGRVAISRAAPEQRASLPLDGPVTPAPAWSGDDLLTVIEAASALRVSPRWLYRHGKTLPFARKLSRKVLRFSRAGITRWLITKRP
jgi:predicted DNA-binding transcriptional regulator AlpA